MYRTHSLKSNLQEWKNRMSNASLSQFGSQVKFFLAKIEQDSLLMSILHQISLQYFYDEINLRTAEQNLMDGTAPNFDNATQHAAFGYQFLKYLIKVTNYDGLNQTSCFYGKNFYETQNNVIEHLITPFVYYLHDQLNNSNFTLYLLERYKMRTEWFMKDKLSKFYESAESNYEQIFEDDLRLYLFDQGIEYPFSTPKSISGRADIVGEINTENPIVIEVKIFDRDKSYGKNRIKEGFTQIVKYTGDYSKDFGYLVVFNMDKAELNFTFEGSHHRFPPVLNFNDKIYFFIVINCLKQASASKIGKIEAFEISEKDII